MGSGFLPVPFIPALGATATFAWAAFALLLLIDAWPRNTALATAVLLLLFALSHDLRLRSQSALWLLPLRRSNAAFYWLKRHLFDHGFTDARLDRRRFF